MPSAVEGAVGRFRRRQLVPVPKCSDFVALNRQLRAACVADEERRIEGRVRTIREDWEEEQRRLQALPKEAFDSSEICRPRVDTKGRVLVRTNRYSFPLRLVGLRVEARIGPLNVEMFHSGQRVAVHERLQGRHGEKLELDHYLELLEVKPGRFEIEASTAGTRARMLAGRDRLWEELKRRYGEAKGTGHLLKVLMLHRESESAQVHEAVSLALELGACDATRPV